MDWLQQFHILLVLLHVLEILELGVKLIFTDWRRQRGMLFCIDVEDLLEGLVLLCAQLREYGHHIVVILELDTEEGTLPEIIVASVLLSGAVRLAALL